MTVKTRATINSEADTNINDNTAGEVSPADVRTRVKDLADSALFPEDPFLGVVVRAATTANITVATALNDGDTLDGVTLATGDLVLVKDQSAAAENGVYVVGVSPARYAWFDTYNKHVGKIVSVAQGAANADTLWRCTSDAGGTLGTTALTFASDIVMTSRTQTLTNKTLTDPAIIGTILEDVYTITDGAAFEIDPGNGSIQLVTLGANRTPKGTNFAAGESLTLMVDDGTARTLTWTDATWGGSGVVWTGGSAPTLATTGYTVIELWKVGTQVYGAHVGNVA
jgi:hypothetical protein